MRLDPAGLGQTAHCRSEGRSGPGSWPRPTRRRSRARTRLGL